MSRHTRHEWISARSREQIGKPTGGRRSAHLLRRLGFELLEDRRLLSITVDTLVDENDGVGIGDISLRDAIAAATPGETINFAVTGTITLAHGELSINKSLTIDGPGSGLLTVDAQQNSRVFNINDGNAGNLSQVTLRDLTITGGAETNGGGIWSFEQLTISGSTIADNSANQWGGGLLVDGGVTTISVSTISGNSAGAGGGIMVRFHGEVNVERSTVAGNTATGAPYIFSSGGGVHNEDSTVNVVASTISGNAADYGAGLYSRGGLTDAETLVRNSTVSGNVAAAVGGGIYNFGGHLVVEFSTITGNEAGAEGDGVGLWADSAYTLNEFRSSIVVGNNDSDVDLVGGPLGGPENTINSNNFNAVETGNALASFDESHDVVVSAADLALSPLLDNGGPTKTHALLSGSVAIDAGDVFFTPLPDFDQRGEPFARVFDGDGIAAARMDIGAFEAEAAYFLVDTLVDEDDGIGTGFGTSLRDALAAANSVPVDSSIVRFDPSLTEAAPETSLLYYGPLSIASNVTITGPGADRLTIDAQQNSRVFNVDDGDEDLRDVTIHGLSITGGIDGGGGGGIFNNERLTLSESALSGNEALWGGGVYNNYFGDLTVVRTTISGNLANDNGGGVYNWGGLVTISSSTISGNEATHGGGGIVNANFGTMELEFSTVTNNQTGTGGGGIAQAANLVVRHSIVAGNLRGIVRDDVSGFFEAHFSLIGDDTGALINDVEGNLIGSGASPINPMLAPLALNGGTTQSHALLAGSPALDAGDANAEAGENGVPATDQRGAGRIRNGDAVPGAVIDIGAFEAAGVGALPELLGDYNLDGIVDAADYTLWRNTLGDEVGQYEGADGNGNGLIGPGDYTVWKLNYGNTLPPPLAGGGGIAASTLRVLETTPPSALPGVESAAIAFPLADANTSIQHSASSLVASRDAQDGDISRDDALVAWVAASRYADSDSNRAEQSPCEFLGDEGEANFDDVDAVFATLGDDWPSALGDGP